MELLILFSLLQIGDAYSTLRFLKHGVKEANPLLRFLFEQMEPLPALIVTKIIVVAVAYATMGVKYWSEGMIGLCVLYAGVVIHNWRTVK